MDGLNLPVQTSHDQEIENSTFNSWLQEHFIISVFAFEAEDTQIICIKLLNCFSWHLGIIIACNLNAPGSWHDSYVGHPIYEKLCL